MSPDPTAYEQEGYHQFHDPDFVGSAEVDPNYGSFEVFWSEDYPIEEEGDTPEPGWYWRACFPGCLPDGDPIGPFDTSQEAYEDAQDI